MNRVFNIFLVFTLFFAVSCKKERLPVCTITHPQDGQEFYEDEDIQIKVVADDDNGFITSVFLFIDNKSYSGTSVFPYNFTVKAGDIVSGIHNIKAVAHNNTGKKGETSVSINVKPCSVESPESPDFVTFSNGKIPLGWEKKKWNITYTLGYDDDYSLFTDSDSAIVTTTKTCNYLEFYTRGGSGAIVKFYVDDQLLQEIIHPIIPEAAFWKKSSYDLSDGFHTFKWELKDNHRPNALKLSFVYMDAIRFETKTD